MRSHSRGFIALLAVLGLLTSCREDAATTEQGVEVASPCTGTWPSYWQDPAFDKVGMWRGQHVSNTPASQNWTPANPIYTNPPFQLADGYAQGSPDPATEQEWRSARFDRLFQAGTPADEKERLAQEYGWALMRYVQEGNVSSGDIDTDWNPCTNKARQWYHMPFQTYHVLQGREFIHGLTREASVKLSVKSQPAPLGTTIWAVAFYNGNAAPTLAAVWRPDGSVAFPKDHLNFGEGTVVAKLLFTTATAGDLSFLRNMPVWTANTSEGGPPGEPTFCRPPSDASMPAQSTMCPREPRQVTLFQFDVAVRDKRASSGWVFGTFVADGVAKGSEINPWDRISLLGLMWGDDTPPLGTLASTYPAAPKVNGFEQGVIAWDVADRLNSAGGAVSSQSPGHLGCNSRLNGPADNVSSSCTSCHMTASVPDADGKVPPLLAQFAPNLTPQCQLPGADPDLQKNGVTFAQMDSVYFAQTRCSSPFNTVLNGVCLTGNLPRYEDGRGDWVSTDFSLQMSIALVQWQRWAKDQAADTRAEASASAGPRTTAVEAELPERTFSADIPLRNEP